MKHSMCINWIILAFLCVFSAFGCRKDTDTHTSYGDSTTEIKVFLSENIKSTNATTTFYFSRAVADTILMTPNQVRIWLADTENIFQDAAGNAVPCSTCDDLKVEVTEVLKKNDMLASNITTVANGELLESGGMIKLRITCNNKPLQLRVNEYIRVQLPVANESDLVTDMKTYYGQKNANNAFNWVSGVKDVYNASWGFDPNKMWGYDILSDSLGWVGAGKLLNDTPAKFCVKLDPLFNDKNTLVYVTFAGKRSIAPTEGSFQNQQFCFDNMPIGYPVKIVTISKIGENWYLGKNDTETGTNSVVDMDPEEVSEIDLVDYLQGF
jgi:hypothetical protein